jgi:hypothetical protein
MTRMFSARMGHDHEMAREREDLPPRTTSHAVVRTPREPQMEIGVRTQSAFPPKAQETPHRKTMASAATTDSAIPGRP